MSLNQTSSTHFQRPSSQLPPESILFGHTEHMQALRSRFEKIAALDLPVLIEGESGTGKDIIARMLHQRSPWMSGVFIKVRCSSIPDSIDALLESSAVELRAQATTDQAQLAYYGTLFLDEISEVNPALQATLLRLLQEGHFCSINLKQCKLRLRLVCATTCVLEQAAERGSFRRDLLYRLNALTLRMLPLRQRMIDLPELVSYFLAQFSQPCDSDTKPLSRRLMQCFLSYSWPGNIRELENLMKRYVLFGCDEAVCRELLEGYGRSNRLESSGQNEVSLKELTRNAVRELERDAILKVLEANHWNRRRAACALNISYRALLYKLKDAAITSPSATNGNLAPAVGSKAIA